MSVYSNLILSLNPVRYGRCDELLAGVLTDSSTFAKHGTTESGATFGLPSAIQTDPASSAIGGPVGRFPAAAGEEADLKGNFTWMFWIFYDTTQTSGVAVCRRGQLGLTHSVQAGINVGAIFADITLESDDFFPLVSPLPLVDQTWYFVTVVRNGTNARLYVNAALGLGQERTDLTTADVDYNVDGTDWFLGRSVNTSAFPSTRLDEVALFDYAISESVNTQVYEAALNAIFLNGQSNVLSTAILLSAFEPDPISFPAMRHNWAEVLVERLSFRSDISQTITGVEEGNGLRIAPRRELEFTQVMRNNEERRKLRAKLWANQHAKWFIPVRQYAEQLAAPLSAGATTTPISTQYKDYEVGLWIGFRQYDADGRVEHSEEQLITSLSPLQHAATVNDYVAHRSIVYPVRRALIQSSLTVKGHTDAVEEVVFIARLLPEDEQVTLNRITPFSPTIKYRDYEVFDGQLWQSHDWSEQREYEIERAGELVDFETGLISFESDTVGVSETFTYQMKLEGLDNIARFLGWYYERVGALRSLWVPTMQEDFEIAFINTPLNQIEVRDTNYSDNYALAEPRRDLAFVYRDGSMIFRRVIAFEVFGSNEKLTLDAGVPTTINLRFISLLKFCRLDADQLELAWHTDDTVVVAWRFRELLHTPEGVGASSLSPSASQSVSLSPSHSPSPSGSVSLSPSPSASGSPSASASPSASVSPSGSLSPSSSISASSSLSLSPSSSGSPSASQSPTPSSSASLSPSPSSSASPSA